MTATDAPATSSIRAADARDGRAVRRLVFDILDEYHVPADPDDSDRDVMTFGEPADPRTLYFVAEADDAVIGCVIVTPAGDGYGKLSKLFVDSRFRRQGIGRDLMNRALDRAGELDYRTLIIHTRARYREAVCFYESSGWLRGPDNPGPGPERSYSYPLK